MNEERMEIDEANGIYGLGTTSRTPVLSPGDDNKSEFYKINRKKNKISIFCDIINVSSGHREIRDRRLKSAKLKSLMWCNSTTDSKVWMGEE